MSRRADDRCAGGGRALRPLVLLALVLCRWHSCAGEAAADAVPTRRATPADEDVRRHARFAYLAGDDGALLKLDMERLAVAGTNRLSDVAGLRERVPPAPRGDDVRWAVSQLVYDRPRGLLLMVVPKPGTAAGERWLAHRVLALVPPALTLAASFDIPSSTASTIHFVVSPDTGRLWLSYWTDDPAFTEWLEKGGSRPDRTAGEAVVEDVDPATWTRLELVRQPVSDPSTVSAGFRGPTWFGADGQTLFDAGRQVSFADGAQISTPGPPDVLSEAQQETLRRLGVDRAAASVIAADGGRVLYVAPDRDRTGWGAWVVDTAERRAVSIVSLPPSRPYLTDGGRRLVALELNRPAPDGAEPLRTSGRVLVYDTDTGALATQRHVPEMVGTWDRHGVVCIAPDGSALLAHADGKLLVIDLAGERSVLVPESFHTDRFTACAFADC